jgi:hypothetical protein
VPLVEAPAPGLRFEDAGLDVGEVGVADADVGADAVVLGLVVFVGVDVGVGVAVTQGVPVAVAALLLPVALTLAGAETVALPLAVAVALAVVVAVSGADAAAVSPGLEVPAGVLLAPLLVLPLAGLVTELAGDAVGVTDLLGVAEPDGDELGAHAGGVELLWPMVVAPWLRLPLDAPCWVAVPARLGGPLVLCEEVIPTAVLSW